MRRRDRRIVRLWTYAKDNTMNRATTCITAGVLSIALSGCGAALLGPALLGGTAATGAASSPSNVTENYTNAEFETCLASLGPVDHSRAQDAMESVMFIPGVGPLLAEERYYEEIEEICLERGTLPRRGGGIEEVSQ